MIFRGDTNIRLSFLENDIESSILIFRRCTFMMKTVVSLFDVLRTMTPTDFNKFRGFLGNASGLQSYQFREVEFILGYKREELISFHKNNTKGHEALIRRFKSPSVTDALYNLIESNGFDIPESIRSRTLMHHIENEQVQEFILSLYKEKYFFKILVEAMLDFDEVFLEWRHNHLKVVERAIGRKIGTGGSTGKDKVRNKEEHKFFPDLWAIRDKL
jgi:tryptophan 2,3-dioxygenase